MRDLRSREPRASAAEIDAALRAFYSSDDIASVVFGPSPFLSMFSRGAK